MRHILIVLLLIFGIPKNSYCQSSVYIGGGFSSMNFFDFQSVALGFGLKEKWLPSPDLSILAKSAIANNIDVSLGVIYNFQKFEAPIYPCSCIYPSTYVNFSRYAMPLRVHWKKWYPFNFSTGITFNSIYREQYTKYRSEDYVVERYKPDIALNVGLGGEWKNFLIDLMLTRSIFETEVLGYAKHWAIDLNIYYKILSSKSK